VGSESMIERVSRTMCREHIRTIFQPETLESIVEIEWKDWVPEARAALQALMEPTDHMVWKGEGMSDFMLDGECFDNSGDGRRVEMKMAFKVMIEAALEEHEILQARSIRSTMEGE